MALKRPGLKKSASKSYTIRNNDAKKSRSERLRKDAAQEQTTKGTGDRSTNDTNEKCVRAFKINNILSVQEKKAPVHAVSQSEHNHHERTPLKEPNEKNNRHHQRALGE